MATSSIILARPGRRSPVARVARSRGVGPIAIGAQTLSGDGRDCVVGHEGGVDDKAGRVALRYVANDDLEFNVIGDYTRDDDEAPVSKYLLLQSMPPNALLALWNQQVAIPIFGVGLGNQFLTGGKFSNYETYSDPLTGLSYPNEDDTTHWGVSGTIDYQLGRHHAHQVDHRVPSLRQ